MRKELLNYLRNLEANFWKGRKSNLKPSIFQHDYLQFHGLSTDIALGFSQIRKTIKKKKIDIVDVGCGEKPYMPLFARYVNKYVGVDIDPRRADVVAKGEQLPFENNSFDLALCFQTLEHCNDPQKVVGEINRVLVHGGFAMVSTHGSWIYHPNPNDYYRWTDEGLEKLFSEFSEVNVKANLGFAGSIIQLINLELYGIACRNLILKLPIYGVITLLNLIGRINYPFGSFNFTLNYLLIAKKSFQKSLKQFF